MASETSFDLRPNAQLLDANFDGYKLSLERFLPVSKSFQKAVFQPRVDPQLKFSFNDSKQFLLFNSLVEDRFNLDCNVYFIDAGFRVHELRFVFGEIHDKVVATIPNSDATHFPCLSFCSTELAVATNGGTNLFFFKTGPRKTGKDIDASPSWKLLSEVNLDCPCSVAYSVGSISPGVDCFEFVLVLTHTLRSEEDTDSKPDYKPDIKTVSTKVQKFVLSPNNSKSEEFPSSSGDQKAVRSQDNEMLVQKFGEIEFVSSKFPDMVSLNANGTTLQVAGCSDFQLKHSTSILESELKWPKMVCSQNEKILKVDISQLGVLEKNIDVEILSNTLKCLDKEKNTVIVEGVLFSKVEAEKCTWSVSSQNEKQVITVMLEKSTSDVIWDKLFECDGLQKNVTMALMDAEQSDVLVEEEVSKPYNFEELDACDEFTPAENNKWLMFSLSFSTDSGSTSFETAALIRSASLHAHEFLFARSVLDGEEPSVCLRHDVDGLLWESSFKSCSLDLHVESTNKPWEHTATFNALGFVQASKRDKKFMSCAPSCRYVAIAECSRRLYLYMQPEQIESALINRKTGRKVPKIAKQYVITLDSNENISGLACLNDCLFILLTNEVLVYNIL